MANFTIGTILFIYLLTVPTKSLIYNWVPIIISKLWGVEQTKYN